MRSLSLPSQSSPHFSAEIIKAAPDFFVAVPDVAKADDVDGLLLFVFHLEKDAQVLLGTAARPKDRDVDLFVGPLHAADGGMGKSPRGHHRTGRCARRLDETSTAHLAIVSHRILTPVTWEQDHGQLEKRSIHAYVA